MKVYRFYYQLDDGFIECLDSSTLLESFHQRESCLKDPRFIVVSTISEVEVDYD